MSKASGAHIVQEYDTLAAKRSTMEGIWNDVEKYCMAGINPNDNTTATKAYTLKKDIYNNTAFRSSAILASGLYSHLTNPSSDWFMLAANNVNEDKGFQDWLNSLDIVTKYVLFNSNFYTTMAMVYENFVHYGVALLYSEFDPMNVIKFSSYHPRNFVFDEDVYGKVTKVLILFKLTAEEAVEKFGNAVSDKIKKALESSSPENKNKRFDFILYAHKVRNKDGTIMTEDVYVEKESKKVVSQQIHNTPELPYIIARWSKKNNYLYGSSPSMVALPDVKTLNRIDKSVTEALEAAVHPPMSLPYDGYIEPIYLTPGGLNYRLTSDPKDKAEPLYTVGDISAGIKAKEEITQNIQEAYFVDLFMMLQDNTMTATEVMQRAQEKMLLLGTVVGRITHELLTPLIRRVLDIMFKYGIVANPFNINPYGALDIHYLSPLAQAQKAGKFNGMLQTMNTALQIAQLKPEILDNINTDYFIREIGNLLSVPSPMFVDMDTVNNEREQRAKAIEQQQKAQALLDNAKAIKQSSGAQKDVAMAKKIEQGG